MAMKHFVKRLVKIRSAIEAGLVDHFGDTHFGSAE